MRKKTKTKKKPDGNGTQQSGGNGAPPPAGNGAQQLAEVLKSADPTLTIREGNSAEALAEHAQAIRELGKRVVKDVIEIGRRLTEAKELVVHGKWAEWLETEFDWSEGTALNFMHVFEFVEELKSKNKNFTDLDISNFNLNIAPSAMYALARPGTSEEVREEIMDRAVAGEPITHKTVQDALTTRKGANGSPPTTESGPHNGCEVQETEQEPAQQEQPQPQEAPDVITFQRWFKPIMALADAINRTQCGHVTQGYLKPVIVRKALSSPEYGSPEQAEAIVRAAGTELITLADKLKGAGTPPMFNDAPGEAAPDDDAPGEAAPDDDAPDDDAPPNDDAPGQTKH
jgi:hypothetical protein